MTSDESPASGKHRTEREGEREGEREAEAGLPAPAAGGDETCSRSDPSPGDPSKGDDDISSTWLFSEIRLRSAAEELEEVYLKKARGLRNAAGDAMEARMARAYEIARECLLEPPAPHPPDQPQDGRHKQVD